MTGIQVRQRRDDLIGRYCPWTAQSIHLGDNVYTFDRPNIDARLRRCLQTAADIVFEPLDRVRVVDLGCLEGQYGIEFALHGSKVVGIEGREVNLAKAQFAKDVLSLHNLELVHDDVRNFNRARYGEFEVVLCLGILYHLDTPDMMDFVHNIFESCNRVTIIDTHFSLKGRESYVWKENAYYGEYTEEHKSGATEKQQLDALWHSIGNSRSFLLTRASLCNLLRHVGFTSVYECLNPYDYLNPNWPLPAQNDRHAVWKNRTMFVAIKGQRQTLMSSPITQASREIDRPEKAEYYQSSGTMPGRERGWARTLFALLPGPAKKVIRKMYHLALRR
jgi:SAM-dependent methyltransferase